MDKHEKTCIVLDDSKSVWTMKTYYFGFHVGSEDNSWRRFLYLLPTLGNSQTIRGELFSEIVTSGETRSRFFEVFITVTCDRMYVKTTLDRGCIIEYHKIGFQQPDESGVGSGGVFVYIPHYKPSKCLVSSLQLWEMTPSARAAMDDPETDPKIKSLLTFLYCDTPVGFTLDRV